uniref:Uncharacterized protein n=1 Tax=Cacopsylla melanoneura TaxID=428564 RepID=A0A8D9BUD7_9HEMI
MHSKHFFCSLIRVFSVYFVRICFLTFFSFLFISESSFPPSINLPLCISRVFASVEISRRLKCPRELISKRFKKSSGASCKMFFLFVGCFRSVGLISVVAYVILFYI